MRDYPTTPTQASTPDPETPTAANVEQLLATLNAIPLDELPLCRARDYLAQLIQRGHVDNLYKPMGADYHNLTWAHMPAHRDPRERVSRWAACVYGGLEPSSPVKAEAHE